MTMSELQEKLNTLSLQRCFHTSPSLEPVSVVSTYLKSTYDHSGNKLRYTALQSLRYLVAGDSDACRSEHQYVTEPQDVRRLPGTKSNATSADYVARIM
jgi:hypothetical protein